MSPSIRLILFYNNNNKKKFHVKFEKAMECSPILLWCLHLTKLSVNEKKIKVIFQKQKWRKYARKSLFLQNFL